MHKGKIFFICGIAGAGKGTLIKGLLKEVSLNLKLVLSYKTREPRIGEILGKDYVKLSVSEFKEAINRKEFLEYNFVHNQDYYGTKFVDVVDNGINTGINVVKEIDPLILPKLLEEKKIDRKDFLIIFLHISPEIVKERMLDRGDDINGNDYKNRLESARKEEELLHLADYVIDATKTKEEVLNEAIRIIKLCISTL